jgi:hypothetical protein
LIFCAGAGLVPSRKPASSAPQRTTSTYGFQRLWFSSTSFSKTAIRLMVTAVEVEAAIVVESETLDVIEEAM